MGRGRALGRVSSSAKGSLTVTVRDDRDEPLLAMLPDVCTTLLPETTALRCVVALLLLALLPPPTLVPPCKPVLTIDCPVAVAAGVVAMAVRTLRRADEA